jgi:hypothetical protein
MTTTTTMTTAAEAKAAIAQVADLIDKLSGVIERETALVHAGRVRDASALASQKSELTSKLYVVGERLKANAKFLRQGGAASVWRVRPRGDAPAERRKAARRQPRAVIRPKVATS